MRRVWNGALALLIAGGLLGLAACGDDDGGDCLTGQTDCGGVCVDLLTDPDYCGDCNTVCALDEDCVGGYCVAACGFGLTDCDGMCVDLLNDPDYCGDCEIACGPGEACKAGQCTCGAQGPCRGDQTCGKAPEPQPPQTGRNN